MASFALLISYVVRDITRNRTLLILIVSGLSIASAAILLTIGILNGFRGMLSEGEEGWLADIVISPIGDDTSIAEGGRLAEELGTFPEVEAFSMRSQGNTVIRYGERKASPFRVIGIDTESTDRTTWLPSKMMEGNFFESGAEHPDEVVIGRSLADSLVGSSDDGKMVSVGEDVYILASEGQFKRFRVRGIIDAKTFFPNWGVFLTKHEYEKLDISGRNTQMIVKLKPNADRNTVLQKLQNRFPRANVRTWEEESGYVKDILAAVFFITESIHYLLVLTVFMVVSVVIYINVSQKKRQIGILKSMGAKNSFVLLAYLLESFVYAGIAFFFGILLFLLLYRFSVSHPIPLLIGDFHIVSSFDTVFSAWLTIFVATVCGGFVPALIAARMRIVDVMRGTV